MEVGLGDYSEPVDGAIDQEHQSIDESGILDPSLTITATEDQLVRCRLERYEDEEIRKLEEDRLQEIIRLCQSYNDAQEGKRVRSLRVNEVDRLLELMKKPDVVQSTTVDNNRLETSNGSNTSALDRSADSELSEVMSNQDSMHAINEIKYYNEADDGYDQVENVNEYDTDGRAVNVAGDCASDNIDPICAKLTALSIEESLIRGEIDDMKHQQFSDAEDEELKEFQRIEKEIKLNELYKCLETIEHEIIAIKQQQLQEQQHSTSIMSQSKQNFLQNQEECKENELRETCSGLQKKSKEAPLASCESDESTSSDDDVSLKDKVKSADFSRLLQHHQSLNNHHTYSSIYSNETNSESLGSSKNEIDGENKNGANDTANSTTSNSMKLRRGSKGNDFGDLKEKQQRPLTIYLPSTAYDLDLIDHIVNLGHDVETFNYLVQLTPTSCSGYLWKLCSNTENQWRKRYFLFDRQNKVFVYFKSFKGFVKAKKAKYGVYFNQIEDAYVDHNRTKLEKKSNPLSGSLRRRSSSTRHVFVVVTSERNFTLSSFVPEVMRIWIDVIFTGAEGYLSFE